MAELNKVLMIGRLTKDPEMRYTPAGTAVASFRLASNHTYKTKEGEKREEVCFIDVSVMGRSAETVKTYLTKGREIFVEGRLQYRTWDGPDGQKRSKYEVIADRFQFLGGRGSDAGRTEAVEEAAEPAETEAPPQRAAPRGAPEQEAEDDLPF